MGVKEGILEQHLLFPTVTGRMSPAHIRQSGSTAEYAWE